MIRVKYYVLEDVLHFVHKITGFDVGSTTAKIVVLENGKLLKKKVIESRKWKELIDYAEGKICSTGYFRKVVPNDISITEISAAIEGVKLLFPKVECIIDIGGQDTKVIDVRSHDFILNDKCSAGTGAFLEFTAKYFDIPVSELGKLHFKSKKHVPINNTCGVFAISEMISQLVAGYSIEDVIAGMHDAFAKRIIDLVPDVKNVVLIGGTVKNDGLVDSLAKLLRKRNITIKIPEDPQIVNALGAAEYLRCKIEYGNKRDKGKKRS
ncbi:MAG: acyl-CoA dehydratase activase [Thermoplasmata archaeon]